MKYAEQTELPSIAGRHANSNYLRGKICVAALFVIPLQTGNAQRVIYLLVTHSLPSKLWFTRHLLMINILHIKVSQSFEFQKKSGFQTLRISDNMHRSIHPFFKSFCIFLFSSKLKSLLSSGLWSFISSSFEKRQDTI